MNAMRNLLKRCGRTPKNPEGCLERKQSTCRHAWHFTMRRKGAARFWVSLDAVRRARGDHRAIQLTRAEAEALARVVEAEVRGGTYTLGGAAFAAAEPSSPAVAGGVVTFGTAADAVLEEKSDLASSDQERSRYDCLKAIRLAEDPAMAIGDWALDRFNLTNLNRAFKLVAGELGNSSKRKYRRAIKRAFTVAVRNGWLVASPFDKEQKGDPVLKAGACAMRDMRVPRALEARLLRAARATVRGDARRRMIALIVSAVECGARKGELLAMKWADIDFARNRIKITAIEEGARKGGEGHTRTVPLTPRMRRAIARLRMVEGTELELTAYVFHNGAGGRVTSIDWAWRCIVARAYGITLEYKAGKNPGSKRLTAASIAALEAIEGGGSLHFHDLRHEAALRWHAAHVELTAIAKLLGHADLAQLRVYLGIREDDALEAFDRAMGARARKVAPVLAYKARERKAS